MPNTLAKNLNLCFSKIKRPLNPQSSDNPSTPPDYTPQFPQTAAASILFTNFNSLYNLPPFDSAAKSFTSSEPDPEPEPDFATVLSSQRFFFTSPGSSNSIIESSPSSTSTTDPGDPRSKYQNTLQKSSTVRDSVAVSTLSPDPFMDFRRSMAEMVEALDLVDVKANWEFLRELLSCYLALNPKSTHKFIIGAFADVLVSLMVDSGGGRREIEVSDGGRSISEQCTCNLV